VHLQAHDGEVVVVLVLDARLGNERGCEEEDEAIARLKVKAAWRGKGGGGKGGGREGEVGG